MLIIFKCLAILLMSALNSQQQILHCLPYLHIAHTTIIWLYAPPAMPPFKIHSKNL